MKNDTLKKIVDALQEYNEVAEYEEQNPGTSAPGFHFNHVKIESKAAIFGNNNTHITINIDCKGAVTPCRAHKPSRTRTESMDSEILRMLWKNFRAKPFTQLSRRQLGVLWDYLKQTMEKES